MKSKPYDVVLLPETDLIKKALGLSMKLETLGVYFTLGNKSYFPHLSIYMLQLNKAGLKKAINSLSKVADKTNIIEAKANNYHYENDYIDIEYVRSREFVALQKKVVEKLNPIRDGMREKDRVRLSNATGEIRFNLVNYGYRFIGNMFSPHLTFTRFRNNQEKKLQSLPPARSFSGKYTTLGIFEMGNYGTCVKKVKTWKL